jgi:hypothetical protein
VARQTGAAPESVLRQWLDQALDTLRQRAGDRAEP